MKSKLEEAVRQKASVYCPDEPCILEYTRDAILAEARRIRDFKSPGYLSEGMTQLINGLEQFCGTAGREKGE